MSWLETFGASRRVDAARIRFAIQACMVVGIAVAVRVYQIGQPSLWTDELFSRYYPDLFSLKFIWTTGFLHENSPPLYYMAIAGWMRLFGTSEAALRSLSLVASVLTLPLIYLIGKELFDRRHGMLAALIFALSPMQVSFAQEARTYALLLIPISVALLAITHFLRGDIRPRTLFLYGISAVVAIYCHATAAFFIAACNIAVITAVVSDSATDRRLALTRWIVANALVALAVAPELVAMLVQRGHGLEWIPPFKPIDVLRALSPVVSGTATPDRFPGAELSLFLIAGLAIAFVPVRSRRIWTVLVAIPVLFIVLIAAVSLFQPIFIARVFSWLGIPLALLLAHVLVMPSRARPIVAVIAAATCVVGMAYQYTASHKEPWRDVFEQIGPQLTQADEVVLAPMTDPTAFAYYAPYLSQLRMWDAGPHDNVENGEMPRRMGAQMVTRQHLIDDIRSGENVWLVLRTPDIPFVNTLLEHVPPPQVRIERVCGEVLCIAALSWPKPSRDAGIGVSTR